jgi:hypothetical protein
MAQRNDESRKCAHNVLPTYAEIVTQTKADAELIKSENVDMESKIEIKIAFHFMAVKSTYEAPRVQIQINHIMQSLNFDFNASREAKHSSYKIIINDIFGAENDKAKAYLDEKAMPEVQIANIKFSLGQIYFYPLDQMPTTLSSGPKLLKDFISASGAGALFPDKVLNIWVMDVPNIFLGWTSFPWDELNSHHGIIISREAFFPEVVGEVYFSNFKFLTHHVGHYLGLPHLSEEIKIFNPSDKLANAKLHTDPEFNPILANFMDNTVDKYVCLFTKDQVKTMRRNIFHYLPDLNFLINKVEFPKPLYDPISGAIHEKVAAVIGQSSQSEPKVAPKIPDQQQIQPQDYRQQFGMQMVPQNYMSEFEMEQLARTQAYNKHLSTLAPNLMATTNSKQVKNREQLIANIQMHLPQNTTLETPDAAHGPHMPTATSAAKEYLSYNSKDGYAMLHPWDSSYGEYYGKYGEDFATQVAAQRQQQIQQSYQEAAARMQQQQHQQYQQYPGIYQHPQQMYPHAYGYMQQENGFRQQPNQQSYGTPMQHPQMQHQHTFQQSQQGQPNQHGQQYPQEPIFRNTNGYGQNQSPNYQSHSQQYQQHPLNHNQQIPEQFGMNHDDNGYGMYQNQGYGNQSINREFPTTGTPHSAFNQNANQNGQIFRQQSQDYRPEVRQSQDYRPEARQSPNYQVQPSQQQGNYQSPFKQHYQQPANHMQQQHQQSQQHQQHQQQQKKPIQITRPTVSPIDQVRKREQQQQPIHPRIVDTHGYQTDGSAANYDRRYTGVQGYPSSPLTANPERRHVDVQGYPTDPSAANPDRRRTGVQGYAPPERKTFTRSQVLDASNNPPESRPDLMQQMSRIDNQYRQLETLSQKKPKRKVTDV